MKQTPLFSFTFHGEGNSFSALGLENCDDVQKIGLWTVDWAWETV